MDAGCRLLYFNIYDKNILVEQVCVEFICSLFQPTKFVFQHDQKGNIISYRKLVGVFDSTYTFQTTEVDKIAFEKLDSISSILRNRKINVKEIKGFVETKKVEYYGFIPVDIKLQLINEKYGM